MTKIIIEKNKIMDSALSLIRDIRYEREHILESGVRLEMSRRFYGNWFPAKTREEAIDRLKKQRDGYPSYIWHRDADFIWAKNMIKLCELHVGAHIELGRKDALMVRDGLEALERLEKHT